MTGAPIRRAVALDGGTTNTRARLIEHGRVTRTSRRAIGVRDSVHRNGRQLLAAAVRDVIRDVCEGPEGGRPDAIVAAGMLSSEVGLAAVPHVEAPADLEALARASALRTLPEVADQPILFIPGVRTPALPGAEEGWAEADVMRGEECETLGAWSLLERDRQSAAAFVWPGSHTKLVEVDAAGRILRSHTTLAGELTSAVARHTLLAASLPDDLPDEPDPDALASGARLARREGLGRAAFLVRIAALSGALDGPSRAAFWIGAVLAGDVDHLARHPILADAPRVWVGGRQPQRSLYASWLGAAGLPGTVEAIGDDVAEHASALGALAVAERHRALYGA